MLVSHHTESHLLTWIEVLEVMHASGRPRGGSSVVKYAQSQERLSRDPPRPEAATNVASSREHESVGVEGSGRGSSTGDASTRRLE